MYKYYTEIIGFRKSCINNSLPFSLSFAFAVLNSRGLVNASRIGFCSGNTSDFIEVLLPVSMTELEIFQ